MSSSDKPSTPGEFPDWSAFAEREVPVPLELLSPAAEAAGLLQLYQSALAAAGAERDEVRSAGLRALAQQAVYVFQLEAALDRYQADLAGASLSRVHRHLRVLKDQMRDALTGFGLDIGVPRGRPFDEVAELVQVDGWRHHEQFTAEVVAEVTEPIVKCGGTLVRLGRVVMGAPLEQGTDGGEPPTEGAKHHADSQ